MEYKILFLLFIKFQGMEYKILFLLFLKFALSDKSVSSIIQYCFPILTHNIEKQILSLLFGDCQLS